jgi:hypothetical protein
MKKGWDLGGAFGPHDPETHTIVDIQSSSQFEEAERELLEYGLEKDGPDPEREKDTAEIIRLGTADYVEKDLRKAPWSLEPRESVVMCECMHYMISETAVDLGIAEHLFDHFCQVMARSYARHLDACLLPGGTLTFFDFKEISEQVAAELSNYEAISCEQVNGKTPESYPAQLRLVLRKPV